jgi:CheY-like chemotaxis protein/anti-sigma regulatory factor (Ser/Thr protein kinase)
MTISGSKISLLLDTSSINQDWLRGDPTRLRQVLTNLLSNGIKFSEKGHIILSAQSEIYDGRVRVSLRVEDQGIGIASDKLETLFKPFIQADTSTTREYGGTGLGLTISMKLCEMMGGSISVQSVPGSGSIFTAVTIFNVIENGARKPDLSQLFQYILLVGNGIQSELLRSQLEHWNGNVVSVKSIVELDVKSVHINESGQKIHPNLVIVVEDVINDNLKSSCRSATARGDYVIYIHNQPKNSVDSVMHNLVSGICSAPITPNKLINLFKTVTHDRKEHMQNKLCVNPDNMANKSKRKCVLLVEDNFINQQVAQHMLEELKVDVITANHGKEAIQKLLDNNELSCVFMDCQMPVMDGYTATKKIRQGLAGQHNKDIPIIALTANAMSGDKKLCIDAGMSNYITKPVSIELLSKALEEVLKT